MAVQLHKARADNSSARSGKRLLQGVVIMESFVVAGIVYEYDTDNGVVEVII
jgi:hypothetical protein